MCIRDRERAQGIGFGSDRGHGQDRAADHAPSLCSESPFLVAEPAEDGR